MLQAHLLLLKVIYNTIQETICFFKKITFKASLSPLEYLIFLCHGKKNG